MKRLPKHDLFGPHRPIRSDYAREASYARRRIVSVLVLLMLFGGAFYALWGDDDIDLDTVQTIKAEGPYKEKPSDPGGIDIPHQDVRVYEQLEGKTAGPPLVEHLLPPPEMPKETAPPTPPVDVAASDGQPVVPSSSEEKTPLTQAPDSSEKAQADVLKINAPRQVPVETTVEQPAAAPEPARLQEPAPAKDTPPLVTEKQTVSDTAPKPATPANALKKSVEKPKEEPLSMDKIIEKINAESSSASKTSGVEAKFAVQLASISGEAQAKTMMNRLQQKYASELRGATLRLVRADLGSRGIFHRIQSQPMPKSEANRICASLKQINAECYLVGK